MTWDTRTSGGNIEPQKPQARLIRGTRFDALTNIDLLNHWRWADSRSIDASLDPYTRQQLRNRARYEVANNSYAFGVALAISNAVVGSGARLQILSGLNDNRDIIKRTEWDFAEWCVEINLAEKLRAMRFARFQDGESFAILHTNTKLRSAVKLDVMPIGAERVSGSYINLDPMNIDGIQLDEDGNVVSYRVLTRHPGDVAIGTAQYIVDAQVYQASQVLHWYRRTTTEQHRGAPELTAALNLFALLRRFTLAVVTAAETAADFAAVMYTDSPGDYGGAKTPKPFETYDIERGLMMTCPEGWKVGQLKSEQPTTTYKDFKREILGEIGRSLQIPVNIISGDSSSYNYASGRLDHQEYQKAIRVDQAQASNVIMRPIFREWWREYSLAQGLPRTTPSVAFYWDGFEHVDPLKEANAQAVRLAAHTTNLSIEYGKQGRDWEDELLQIARERDKMAELKITPQDALGTRDTGDSGDE